MTEQKSANNHSSPTPAQTHFNSFRQTSSMFELIYDQNDHGVVKFVEAEGEKLPHATKLSSSLETKQCMITRQCVKYIILARHCQTNTDYWPRVSDFLTVHWGLGTMTTWLDNFPTSTTKTKWLSLHVQNLASKWRQISLKWRQFIKSHRRFRHWAVMPAAIT